MARPTNPTDVGRLRHRVQVYGPDDTGPADDHGQPTDAGELVVECWAAVEPLTGEERFTAARVDGDVTHRVVIRFREEVRALGGRARVVHRGRVFQVVFSRDVDERRVFLELTCKERV